MPLHKNRVWCIGDVSDVSELAKKLTGTTWVLCNGFRIGDYLFLNDSLSEDGAAEYAVVKDCGIGVYSQVNSITFGWCNQEKAEKHIRNSIAGEYDKYGRPVEVRIESASQHKPCHLCR